MGIYRRGEKCASQEKSIKVREASEREGERYVREGEKCVREDVERTKQKEHM